MASGKVREFAIDILQYMASGAMPASNAGGLHLALLSGVPAIAEPFTASSISAVEVSAGQFRASIGTNKFGSSFTAPVAGFMQMSNSEGEITFPSDAPATFGVSGYALCYTSNGTSHTDYLAYEVFNDPANQAKQRTVNINDTVKVNTGGLTVKEQ
jgi:hypothetical protein